MTEKEIKKEIKKRGKIIELFSHLYINKDHVRKAIKNLSKL